MPHIPLKVILPILGVFLIFMISVALAPLHLMKEFESRVNSDSLLLDRYGAFQNRPDLKLLMKEKAFKESLLKLAENDSIQLVINLSDSTVSLSIRGVIIHQTKAKTVKSDRILENMPALQQVKLFSQALAVQDQFATIVKEPVVVRHAPKDTLEAVLNAWQPDTLIQNPAFLLLSAEHGINIILEQDNNPSFQDKWTRFIFYQQFRTRNTGRALSNFVRFRKQEYHPLIKAELPADDLRAIYRALPEKTLIALTM